MNNDIDKDILNSSLDDDNILKKKNTKSKNKKNKKNISCNNYFICRCKRFPAGY